MQHYNDIYESFAPVPIYCSLLLARCLLIINNLAFTRRTNKKVYALQSVAANYRSINESRLRPIDFSIIPFPVVN